jgi:hypothetical protein
MTMTNPATVDIGTSCRGSLAMRNATTWPRAVRDE